MVVLMRFCCRRVMQLAEEAQQLKREIVAAQANS